MYSSQWSRHPDLPALFRAGRSAGILVLVATALGAAGPVKCDKAHSYGDTPANVKAFIAQAHTKEEPLQTILGGGKDEYDDFLTHTCHAKYEPKSGDRAFLDGMVFDGHATPENYQTMSVTDIGKAAAGAELMKRLQAAVAKHHHSEENYE